MRRPLRVGLWALALAAGIAAVLLGVARSDWLAEKVRQEAIRRIATATGGRVDLAGFAYDWRALTVTLDGLTIHGREPEGVEPLASIARLVVRLRVISFLRRDLDVTSIEASRPQVHFVVSADGTTNLPGSAASPQPAARDLLALKVAFLSASDGVLLADRAGQPRVNLPWDFSANKVNARLVFVPVGARYTATLSAAPVHWQLKGYPALDVDVDSAAEVDRDGVRVTRARLTTGKSEVNLSGIRIESLQQADFAGRFQARVALADLPTKNLGGSGTVEAKGEFRVAGDDYRLNAEAEAIGLAVGSLKNIRATGKVLAVPERVEIENLAVGMLQGVFRGRAELRRLSAFHATGKASGFSARELADAIAAKAPPWDGIVSGDLDLIGVLTNSPATALRHATANLKIEAAPHGPAVRGEVAMEWDSTTRKLGLGHSWLELPASRIELSGTVGERLQVKAETADLADLAPVLNGYTIPFTLSNGSAAFNGEMTGPLDHSRLTGHASLRRAVVRGYPLDAAQGDLTVSESELAIRNASVGASGAEAHGTLTIGLAEWKMLPDSPVQGSAELAEADLTHLLSVGQLPNVDATGTVRLTARFFGTSADPRGEADVTLSRGLILQQPYDAITAHVQYLGPAAQALTATFASGPKRVNLTARRTGAPDTFPKGRTAFEISSNTMALSQIALVRERQPDIAGTLEFKASGAVVIGPRWHLESLDATGGTTGIALAGRNLGNSRFTLRGINDVVEARFDSDAAGASIHGEGTVALRDDYPLTATISLADVDLKALEMLTERAGSRSARARQFEGSLRGEVSLRGPLANFEQATGTLDIPQFELRPAKGSPLLRSVPDFALRSSGPLRATLAQSTIRLEAARFEAPATDLTVDGAIQLSRRSPQSEPVQLNLRIRGTANMALARNFIPDLTSSGSIVLDATLRGSPGAPLLSGRANIRGGDFRYAGFSNGLTSVAGEVVFNGARATIQSLTGETGGGKVEATGFAAITGDTVAFRMDGRASGVRVRYPEGVSSVSDVTLTVAGTSERSEASGIVTIHRLAVNPRADLAAIIASAAERQPALADTGLMANMNLDIQVATAPDIAFETNVAQGIQADASLRLRGTAANPALLGRINVSHGELMFFGNKYTISQGAVSFYNPARIEPVLNLDLTTRARGVDVVLTVAGPADRLNMSYRSDPPLEFSDIINLLATGRAPGNQTAASRSNGPASGFEQLGAAALLGEALTNPVAGRLQRFFGVSRLKIDPQLTGVTGSPQARLTIEQQVTPDILFTYITDLAGTNNQLVRVEWSINSQVSAVLGREENGFVGVDFVWKKRFK